MQVSMARFASSTLLTMGTTMASGPASKTRLMLGMSFQVTRTMVGVPAAFAAMRCDSMRENR